MAEPDSQCSCPRHVAKIAASEAVGLADLVAYSAKSVVSRTIGECPTGTMTLFAFDTDQGLSEHSAPFDAFVHVIDGEVELTIGGETLRACQGQMVIMPANVPHAVRAVTPFKMLLTMFRTGTC